MIFPSFGLQGNWVDLVIIIFLVSFIISSLGRGFIINFFDLFGFLFSFFVALKFYPLISSFLVNNFSLPLGIANSLGFIFLGFVIETIFFIFVRMYYELIPQNLVNSFINQLLGPIPAIINGLVIVTFFLLVVISTPIQPWIKKSVFDSRIGSILVSHTQILEKEISEIFGKTVLDTLTFISIEPESNQMINLRFKINEGLVDEAAENEMLKLINSEREKVGLHLLVMNDLLQEVARDYAKDMLKRGYFSHFNPENQFLFDRLEKNQINFLSAGENLAFAPSVITAHQGLMQSAKHRENILSSEFWKVGIGVVDAGVYGKMFVQEFTD